jgi:hypothetical protein
MILPNPLILAVFLACAAANNIYLFESAYNCIGLGISCLNIPNGTCCHSNDPKRKFGSVKAQGDRPTDQLKAFAKYTDGPCDTSFGVDSRSVYRIHECLLTEEQWATFPVSGARWQYSGGFKADMGHCESAVMGDEMLTEGGKMWVISSGKMEGMMAGGVEKPTTAEEVSEFFKTHADTVINNDDVQISDVSHVKPQTLLAPSGIRPDAVEHVAKLDSIPSILRRGPDYVHELPKRGQCACTPRDGPKGDGLCTCAKDARRARRFLPNA